MRQPDIAGPKLSAVMRNQHGAVMVRHPSLPGPHMMQPRQDYTETPPGSMSRMNLPGGISGGLAPFQSTRGAEGGEYT